MRSIDDGKGAPIDARRDRDDTPEPRGDKGDAGLISRGPAAMYGAG